MLRGGIRFSDFVDFFSGKMIVGWVPAFQIRGEFSDALVKVGRLEGALCVDGGEEIALIDSHIIP
jgi:hypothetical protein